MTLESPDSTLERFHRVLVTEIRDRRPEYLSAPFTVAEIYQHLIPYASHRDRLGVEMNGDYEDALLRLLAGKGGYVRVESDLARERMQNEVESPNPDTSLFREFAAVDVRLNEDALPPEGTGGETREDPDAVSVDALAPPPPGPTPEEPAEPAASETGSETRSAPDAPTDAASEAPASGPAEVAAADAARQPGADALRASAEGRTCSWCRETLPDREKLNFCPFCGTDIQVVPCPSCGEALEPGWLFCIACGAGVSEG